MASKNSSCIVKRFFNKLIHLRELTSIVFLVLIFLVVGAINPNFLNPANITLSLNSSVVYTMVAIGIAVVILTGEIDVSVGATLGMSAAITATMVRDGAFLPVAFLASIALGAFIGLINGFGVAVLKVPSIIMTLGVNSIVRGLIYVYSDGKWIENLPYEFKYLSQAKFLGTNITAVYFSVLAITVIMHLFLNYTKYGKNFAAVGDNVDGSILLGLPVTATKLWAYVICGMFSAIGGIIYASRVGFVTPISGNGYEMKVIAACVLGGISMSGGVGSVIGAAIGSVIMASISRVLVFIGLSSDYDNTITGCLLIIIVVFDAVMQKRTATKARHQRLQTRTAVKIGENN
ncbi:MAG: ABC transporter permease [Christensenellales bacterium]|jgi:AI-2 transport system permease protein